MRKPCVAAAKTCQCRRIHQSHAARLWTPVVGGSAATHFRAANDNGSGIARAVVRNSPIMILDESLPPRSTPESERQVIEGLERLMRGRTVIMIAHRLSTIRDADKIIVLKDGVVVEEGSNDELVALGGVYAELHRIQFEIVPAHATGSA